MSEAPKVFADIDGVFNHARLYAALAARRGTTTPVDWLDPVYLARMNTVCDATGAELVISSAWPSYVGGLDAVVTILRAAGLTAPVVGATPEANPLPLEDPHRTRKGRGYEIRAWLRAHPRVTNYAIVDDLKLTRVDWSRFVRTDLAVGFTDADAAKLRRVLTRVRAHG